MGLEEQEFLSLLQEKRHKEMIGVLTNILTKLEEAPPAESLEKHLKKLAERPMDDVPAALSAISKLIISKLDELKQTYAAKPKQEEWLFNVHYDGEERISHVTVKGK